MKLGLGTWIGSKRPTASGGSQSRIGPMDHAEDNSGLASITVPFDLAAPVIIVAIATRYTGTLTGLAVTHGGQALTPIHTANNTAAGIFSGIYTGAGLTLETANLVVTPIGLATVGPAVLRVDDSFGSLPIVPSWLGAQSGLGSATGQGVLTAAGVVGLGPIAYALASALVTPSPYTGPSTQFTTALNAFAMTGPKLDVPAFSGGLNWTLNAGWWEHSSGVTTLNGGADMAVDLPAPFGYELEVDIPVGSSLSIQLTKADGSYMNTPIRAPITGKVRFFEHTPGFIGKRWRILGNGPVKFRNLKYVVNPVTIQGIFGRSTINAFDGQRMWFYFPTAAQFAGCAAAVRQ